MPVYNAERYLALAVESILNQTFIDFEFIIIDDGSTDNSSLILENYAQLDSRIRLIKRANKGLVKTLNEGISLARAPYIARMDADDFSLPNRFARQIEFLRINPHYVVVGSWSENINEYGQQIGFINEPPTDHSGIDEKNLEGDVAICHPTALIRHDALLAVGGYEPAFQDAEDLELWLRLAEVGKLANLPEVLLKYRVHIGSVSAIKRENQVIIARLSCELAWNRRGIQGVYKVSDDEWRSGTDKASQHRFALQYGWVAWKLGHRKTWWTYARKALALKPMAISSWKLLVFGFLKSPR